jgi:hypothetical protein
MFDFTTLEAFLSVQQSVIGLDYQEKSGQNGSAAKDPDAKQLVKFKDFVNFINAQKENPAVRYRHQLASRNAMGFGDVDVNIKALQAAHGNVYRAIDVLLGDAVGDGGVISN